MQKHTLDLVKKMEFVAKYSPQGNKGIIIVPKDHHTAINKLKNPSHVTLEEILE